MPFKTQPVGFEQPWTQPAHRGLKVRIWKLEGHLWQHAGDCGDDDKEGEDELVEDDKPVEAEHFARVQGRVVALDGPAVATCLDTMEPSKRTPKAVIQLGSAETCFAVGSICFYAAGLNLLCSTFLAVIRHVQSKAPSPHAVDMHYVTPFEKFLSHGLRGHQKTSRHGRKTSFDPQYRITAETQHGAEGQKGLPHRPQRGHCCSHSAAGLTGMTGQ